MPNVNDIILRIWVPGDYQTYQNQNAVLEVFGDAFKIEIKINYICKRWPCLVSYLCSLLVQHLLQWKDVLQMWVSESSLFSPQSSVNSLTQ